MLYVRRILCIDLKVPTVALQQMPSSQVGSHLATVSIGFNVPETNPGGSVCQCLHSCHRLHSIHLIHEPSRCNEAFVPPDKVGQVTQEMLGQRWDWGRLFSLPGLNDGICY
jgi:hypothetical protein